MASRRLRRLKTQSLLAHRRMVKLGSQKQQEASKTQAEAANPERKSDTAGPAPGPDREATRAAKRAKQSIEAEAWQARVRAEAARAAALEEEMRQHEALDARSDPVSSEDDEDEEDEGAVVSESSDEEGAGCHALPGNGGDAGRWDMPNYGGGAKYWDMKHAEDKSPYEWMQGYKDLRKLIAKYTHGDKERRVLHVGCGSSLLTQEMYDDGYQDIVNIDISSVVVNKMREQNKEMRPKMKWLVMDATAMKFESGGFNIVIDKCTLDTLVCCEDSHVVVGKYLKEVVRVLKDNGVYFTLSFGKPAVRMSYLRKHFNFPVEITNLPVPYTKSHFHFAYACRKRAPMP
mmetsp:Transcript_102034/g.284008  ORF Transcript_102034/g.284008 Transcript_102034/m.284008 type:complete len:345 (-) Transcript_102034:168-1202(-)